MKSKAITFFLAFLAVISIAYAYMQRKDAEFQRSKANEMHREVVRLRGESEAARMEAAKLRGLAEIEKQRADAAVQELEKKSRK
jgi:hypothetical protein